MHGFPSETWCILSTGRRLSLTWDLTTPVNIDIWTRPETISSHHSSAASNSCIPSRCWYFAYTAVDIDGGGETLLRHPNHPRHPCKVCGNYGLQLQFTTHIVCASARGMEAIYHFHFVIDSVEVEDRGNDRQAVTQRSIHLASSILAHLDRQESKIFSLVEFILK